MHSNSAVHAGDRSWQGTEISVVVVSPDDAAGLSPCLESLAGQTIDPGRFEVLVVYPGGAGPGIETFAATIAEARSNFPRLRLRTVAASRPGLGAARNAVLAAARGAYCTLVGGHDLVTPEYLTALLARSGPTRFGAAPIVDATDVPTMQTGLDAVLRLRNAEEVLPGDSTLSLSSAVGRLLPTALARSVGFAEDLADGDLLFWTRMLGALPFTWGVGPDPARGVYVRRTVDGDGAAENGAVTGGAVAGGAVADGRSRYDAVIREGCVLVQRLQAARAADATGPQLASFVLKAVTVVASRMNAYLRDRPEQHQRVLDDIRSHGIEDFPYAVLNRGLGRDLAVLYAALPYADTSAIVAARRIRQAGVPVDVLSSDMSRVRHRDFGAARIWREYVDAHAETPTRAAFAWWQGTNAFCERGLTQIDAWTAEKGPYRSVYSRAMWPSAHILGALYKVRHPEVRWIAEFSDPLVHDIHGAERPSSGIVDVGYMAELGEAVKRAGFEPPDTENMFVWTELLAYALADEITFTNDHQREYMLGYLKDPALIERAREVGRIEPHPTLPEEYYRTVEVPYELPDDRLNIAYFGVFYATRGLTEVIGALDRLTAAERRLVRLHVFTSKPDELAEEARETGLDDVLVVNPYVTYLEFLALTTKFDLLLVNDARTSDTHHLNPYMPSKYSDYAGSGSAIWGVVEPGSQLSKRPLAYRSELGDVDGALAVIRTALAAELSTAAEHRGSSTAGVADATVVAR